jgi:hypothetical protein
MIDRIKEVINRWTHGEDWRTWVAHSVIGLIIAFVFGLFGWLGWQVAIAYYLIREIEQTFYSFVSKKPIDWFDNVMDVVVPTIVVLLGVGLFDLLGWR